MTDIDPEIQAVADALEEEYTKDELIALADEFGVEIKPTSRKEIIARAFATDGVSLEVIKGLKQPKDDEEEAPIEQPVIVPAPVVDDNEDLVLIKMTRRNASYEVRGYRFTRDHPFALVTEENADYLVETDGGFRMASPKEAREFYS